MSVYFVWPNGDVWERESAETLDAAIRSGLSDDCVVVEADSEGEALEKCRSIL